MKVAVSFPALYSFAANVVGDTGRVVSVKSTQGAHGSEVTQDERKAIESADVLFINGLGLDDEFARKLQESSANQNLRVVKLGDQLPHKLLLESDGCTCCVEEEGHEGHGDHAHDPHAWLGIDQSLRYVDEIRKELSLRYPRHEKVFAKNADAYIAKLKAIKAEGETTLESTPKAQRTIVTAHGSMGYFARTFGLTVVDTIQKSAGQEPTKQQLDALIKNCRENKVRAIASEPQFSKLGGVATLVEALRSSETPPVVIELDTLETAMADELNADWYEVRMRANVNALTRAFGH